MFRKMSLAFALTLLAAASLAGWAAAATESASTAAPTQDPNHRALLGQVTGIGAGQFTVQARNGEFHTVIISEETIFRSRASEQPEGASFDDLVVDMWVSVINHKDSNGVFFARLVVILPEDFNPDSLQTRQAFGEVDKINNGQNTFDLVTRAGEALTFSTDENTRFFGTISELKDLTKGMTLGVFAVEKEDGALLAKVVTNQKQGREILARAAGKVNAISTDNLVITSRKGESLSFTITDKTRFTSRDANISDLGDLEEGMVVMVVFKKGDADTPSPDAVAIAAPDQDLLNLERAIGEVQSAGGTHLTLQTRNGETLSFSVDDSTRLKGEGIESLQDIKNGMKALVLFKVGDDGSLQAVAVLVRAERGKNN